MKRLFATLLICSIFYQMTAFAQNKIIIPDTDKHLVLTGDMHMHTIFSDGNVWPTTRVEEAHSEGVEKDVEFHRSFIQHHNFLLFFPR